MLCFLRETQMGQFATCVVLGGGRGRGTEHLAEEEGEEFPYLYFFPSYIALSSPPSVATGSRGLGGSTTIVGRLMSVGGCWTGKKAAAIMIQMGRYMTG